MRISTASRSADGPAWMTLPLEVAGGMLTWRLDSPHDAAPHLHLWSPGDADWLWRIVGEQEHVGALTALGDNGADISVERSGDPTQLSILRRLAWGHWLRRWWPTSVADGIEPLNAAVLDIEVALLTEDCDNYFDADSFDGDPEAIVVGHDEDAIDSLSTHFSPDVRTLHRRWLARDNSVVTRSENIAVVADDYALVAGSAKTAAPSVDALARGHASLAWESVPANTFDAAEDTIAWSIDAAPEVVADIAVALLPARSAPPLRVELSLATPAMRVHAALDSLGTARITLPLTAIQAWRTDWSTLICAVGEVPGDTSRDLREQVRAMLRRRLSGADDGIPLFVAEQLVAEADY
ncbi:hypothetical protein [Gordonia sp. CPCC 205333]|uniref:hypothetical protein n=1 Tax=Gordonia sp. CPCC 205333 TaxID=3140790 RepID=UPI003AF3F6EB